MPSDPKRSSSSAPRSNPSPASNAPSPAPASVPNNRGFRALTGAIVTLLLLALVALIIVTLVRFPIRAGEGDLAALPAAPTADLAIMAATATPQPEAPTDAAPVLVLETERAPTPLQETPTEAPPAEMPPQAPLGETPVGDPLVADLQPPPSEDVASPAAEPAAETAPGGPQQLPTPNPAAAPAPGFQIFANANTVNDVALDGASLWAATTGGALRWETASATATTFSADGMGPGPLSAVVVCNMEGFGAVFGGSSGLQIFDSVTGGWSQVTAGSGALAFNDVASLACDAEQGILAVGYRSEGVDIYRRRLDRWSYTAPADGLFTQGATAVAVGPGGVVWAASGGTLVQIQGTRTTTYTPDDSALNGEAITALRTDTDGALWVTAGNRLLRFKDGAWESYDRGAADFPRATLVDVAPIQSGRAWLLSADAEVCRFDPEFESCTPFYAPSAQAANGATVGMVSGPATALDADASGLVAYGTAGQGSSLQARGQWTALAQPAGFPASNRIFALASDARGFLWVATTAGVQQADPARPTEVAYRYTTATDGLLTTNVRTLFADARGGVWLGGIGASYFDGTRWINYTQADGLAGDEITAIAEDSQGRIWFGTRTGLSIWTGTTFFNLTGANGLPDSDILSLAADGPGMWIGSANGGLYRFESNQLQVLTEENVGLPSNRITALLVMDDGTTLVGTDAGLARFDGGIVSRVDGVPATRITALAAAPGGTAWVGAADGGLFVAAGGQSFAPYTTPAGDAPAATVRAITVDLYGSAWIGGDSGGLARIAP